LFIQIARPVVCALACTALAAVAFPPATLLAEYPKPSLYPISWDLDFVHQAPKRIVVKLPNSPVGQAYWYMTYTVTNNTRLERIFLPDFEMLTNDGRVLRSDLNIPTLVFDAIKKQEKIRFLEAYPKIAGELRLGEDQARDGVAIWPEVMPRMGEFTLFVGGLSGEAVALKDSAGQPVKNAEGSPVILRKTLQLNYQIRGDELYPGEDQVVEQSKTWVMR
jgi:hypothetical protein